MFMIFFMALIMTVKAFLFNREFAEPEGAGTGAYYMFENPPDNMELKAFGSYYLLFN